MNKNTKAKVVEEPLGHNRIEVTMIQLCARAPSDGEGCGGEDGIYSSTLR